MSVERVIVDAIIIIAQSISGIYVLLKIENSKEKVNINRVMLSFITFLTLMIFSNYLIPNQVRLFLTILIFTGISNIINKNSIKMASINALMTVPLLTISEVIISFLLMMFGVSQDALMSVDLYKIIINVLVALFIIIAVNIKPIYKFLIKLKSIAYSRIKILLYLIAIFILFYLVIARNALFANVTLDTIINSIILIISAILFLVIIIADNKNKFLEEKNQQMLSYVTKYEKIITEQGKANHEFKNQLMVIRGYAQMKSPKLLEYLDSIADDLNKTHSSYLISQLNKFPDGGIKGLLYYKLSTMEDEKIKYDINVESGVKTKLNSLDTNMYKNITKILGVLLDNAIDASKKSKDKKVIVVVTKEKSNVIFSISNTYDSKIDITKIGTGYTTKGFGHGYGLSIINDIISRNSVLEIEKGIGNQYYNSKLIIKINEKKKK